MQTRGFWHSTLSLGFHCLRCICRADCCLAPTLHSDPATLIRTDHLFFSFLSCLRYCHLGRTREREREKEIGFGGPATLSLSSDRAVFFSCLSCLIPDVPSKRGEPRGIHFLLSKERARTGGRQTIFGPSFVGSSSPDRPLRFIFAAANPPLRLSVLIM